jgi:effector-binding domain-containing protein
MSYEIKLAQAEQIHTAVIRGIVQPHDLKQFVPAACGEVWKFAKSAGLPKPGRHVALYLDNRGSVEVGAEVAAPFIGNDRIHSSHLPVGRVVTTVHFGPYQRLGDAHTAVRNWCAEHAHRLTGVSWEIYGHWEESWNSNPSKIRTDVFYLVEEK